MRIEKRLFGCAVRLELYCELMRLISSLTDVSWRSRRMRAFGDDYAQGLRLKAFQYLNVGCGCCTPELDAISPDWFEDGFVEKELVA
jgi:hypothetical protein